MAFPSASSTGAALLGVALVVAACQGGEGREPSTDIASEGLRTLVVADAPEMTIGLKGGEDPYNLTGVTGVTRLSTGGFAVANCGSLEIRYFDSRGRFVRSVGGRGEGPGEFAFLPRTFPLRADSIAAVDWFLGRITVFPPDGGPARTISLSVDPQILMVIDRLSNGSFVARRGTWGTAPETGTTYRSEVRLLILDSVGHPVDSIPGLPGTDLLVPPGPRGPYLGANFARSPVFAASTDRIYFGAQDEVGIRVFDSTLTQIETIRTVDGPEPVTEQVRARVAQMTDDERRLLYLSRGAFPPMMPSFGFMIVGEDGKLWVQEPRRPDRAPVRWTAYEEGEPVALAELPARFYPFEFGPDWVIGVSFDDLHVERVDLWRLVEGDLSLDRVSPSEHFVPVQSRCTWENPR